MKSKFLISPWLVALAFAVFYGSLNFFALLRLNPKGNNLNWFEWGFSVGACVISVGVIYTLYRLCVRFFRAHPVGRQYLLLLAVSVPVYCGLYLVYWVLLTRKLVYGLHTPLTWYTGQLLISNVFSHLPTATITVGVLYNAQVYNIRLQLLQSEKLVAEARLKNLQQQVDPHFLFNSLNILSALIKPDGDRAVLFTQKLSEVYRYFLKNGNEVVVPLAEDLGFLNDYFYLIECRFGSAYQLQVRNEKAADLHLLYILPGTLQLLMENVIKHNAASAEKPIQVVVAIGPEQLTVVNNCINKEAARSGFGLANLVMRYRLFCQKAIHYQEAEGYYRVSVPLLKNLPAA